MSSSANSEFDIVQISKQQTQEPNKAEPQILTKVEDALEKLGGYSRFQIIATIMISFLEVSAAMVALAPILIGRSDIEYLCQTPEHEEFVTISKDDVCNSSCDGSISKRQEFYSIVNEWDLICDKAWITETFTSIQMAGGMFGSLIMASIADRFGRKKAFFSVAALLGISGFLCTVSPNLYFYAVARFLSGFAVAGSFVAHFNYLMEFLTPAWRTLCGCLSFWAIGEMLLGVVGYLSLSWRKLCWSSSVSAFFVFGAFSVLPESPRFLLCKGRTDEAAQAFRQIAKINSKPPLHHSEVIALQKVVLAEEEGKPKWTDSWKVFQDRRVKINIFIFFIAWFSNAIVYYGLSFNTKNLEGNPYLNIFYLGLIDFPAELSGIYFNNRFGRQKTFSLSLVISSLFLLILVLIEIYVEHSPTLIVIFCLLGRFFNELSWAVMACFTGESFPTVGRSICLSICICAGAIGGILAPQMAYLGSISKIAPYLVFCGLSMLSAALSFMLMEMKGKPLADTVKLENGKTSE